MCFHCDLQIIELDRMEINKMLDLCHHVLFVIGFLMSSTTKAQGNVFNYSIMMVFYIVTVRVCDCPCVCVCVSVRVCPCPCVWLRSMRCRPLYIFCCPIIYNGVLRRLVWYIIMKQNCNTCIVTDMWSTIWKAFVCDTQLEISQLADDDFYRNKL